MSLQETSRRLKELVRSVSSVHLPDGRPNIFIFTTPRSGSTWLWELLCSQPGLKGINEPDDLRSPSVRRHLGISDWVQLYNRDSEPLLRRYFEGLCSGRLGFMNPWPSLRRFRPLTRRIVFKLLHCGEDRISWFRDTFNGRIVVLLRHPIPVALSRNVYPRLRAFLESDYHRHFTLDQVAFARKVIDTGSKLEQGILDWCLQNAVPLSQMEPDWIVVTYEQLLLDPEPVIRRFAVELDLPDLGAMRRRLNVPSRTVSKSDQQTARVLREPNSQERTEFLLEKWRSKVSRAEEDRLMGTLRVFDIDAYTAGELLPTGRFALSANGALTAPPISRAHQSGSR
jgi:hypothetical protein